MMKHIHTTIFIFCFFLIHNLNSQVPVIDSIRVVGTTCDADNGEIIIFASGPGPLSYSIDNCQSTQPQNHFFNLPKGDYLIKVINDNGRSDFRSLQLPDFTILDPPTINCPSNLTVQCSNGNDNISIVENWIEETEAFDARMLSLEVNIDEDLSDLNLTGCSSSVDVLISAEDGCNTEVSCTGTIEVIDTEAPNIVCPVELTVDVEDTNWYDSTQSWLEAVVTSDNCSIALQPENNFDLQDVLQVCEEEFDVEINFFVLDECSNFAECFSSIYVFNELEPTVICDAPMDFGCNQDPEELFDILLFRFEELYAFDEDITIEDDLNYEDVEGLLCGDQFTLFFSVIDQCERMTQCSSDITIVDLEIPTIDICPDPITITDPSIARSEIENWLSSFSGSDNCSAVNLMNNFDTLIYANLCTQAAPINVNFTISDNCVNINDNCTSTLTLTEQVLTITCPSPLTLECGATSNSNDIVTWLEGVGASINTTDVTDLTTNDYVGLSMTPTCDSTISVTFTISDFCENVEQCMSTIQILDTTAPSLTCPDALELSTDSEDKAELVLEWLETALVGDLCSQWESVFPDIAVEALDCNVPESVELTVVDDCDNLSTCITSIILVNDIDTGISCPEKLTFSCNENVASEIQNELELILQDPTYNLTSFDFDPLLVEPDCISNQEFSIDFSFADDCNALQTCTTTIEISTIQTLYFPNTINRLAQDPADRYFNAFGNSAFFTIESMTIFDRWGGVIWQSNKVLVGEPKTGWDGSTVNPGTYTYLIEILDANGEAAQHRGNISLVN